MPLPEQTVEAIRLDHRDRVENIRLADEHRAAAQTILREKVETVDQFADAMSRAAFELLGAVGAYAAAGLGHAAGEARVWREEVARLERRARMAV